MWHSQKFQLTENLKAICEHLYSQNNPISLKIKSAKIRSREISTLLRYDLFQQIFQFKIY